ncbi:hypothetical protein CZ771_00235 [Actinomycetales bacterium JB111]|nr:hypothetical protein CZ771_00235 [Actinomycetales bacterium JB111]
MNAKTLVLDDDPTGTQSTTGARVLLAWDRASLAQALTEHDAVYLQTNSRSLDEEAAVSLVRRARLDAAVAGAALGVEVRIVLRGDSTLRGHVFAESDALAAPATPDERMAAILFVPAFPAGGRTTVDGVHRVEIDGQPVPAHETEYAADPVFGFSSGEMTTYVREGGDRPARLVPLAALRESRGEALAQALLDAGPGEFVVPDAVTEADIDLIHAGLLSAWDRGARIVVRSASPLAARIAGVASRGLLEPPLTDDSPRVLVVCGSHTSGATAQIERLRAATAARVITVSTTDAYRDPAAAGHEAAARARDALATAPVAVLASERTRHASDNTLAHGAAVMNALTSAVRELAGEIDVVVAKGGITSSEVASTGLKATSADVLGQVLPGVSVWNLHAAEGPLTYVVVPGNVGGADALHRIVEALGITTDHS